MCLFQCFLCSLITLAIPSLCSTPGLNIFTPFVCVYKHVSSLWFVLTLKAEVTINGSDHFLAVSYWLSLSLISELLSQGDASRARIGGGAEQMLHRNLAVYLKASLTECTWRWEKLPETCNLGWKIREAEILCQWCQNWDRFCPKRFIYLYEDCCSAQTVLKLKVISSAKLLCRLGSVDSLHCSRNNQDQYVWTQNPPVSEERFSSIHLLYCGFLIHHSLL